MIKQYPLAAKRRAPSLCLRADTSAATFKLARTIIDVKAAGSLCDGV